MGNINASVDLRRDGEIAIITADNPPVNALKHEVRAGLVEGLRQIRDDAGIKAVVIAALTVLMLWPLSRVENLVSERQTLQAQAYAAIASGFGGSQILGPPILKVGTQDRTVAVNPSTKSATETWTEGAPLHLLPDDVQIANEVSVEVRSKGIYSVPVYISKVVMTGVFKSEAISTLLLSNADVHVLPTRAVFLLPLSGVKYLRALTRFEVDGQSLRATSAEVYPSRTVRFITPFGSAGAPDIITRMLAQWLTERLGQSFVVEIRAGGAGQIGTEAVVRAAPDGYTLLVVAPSHVINATLYDKLSYNFLRDIAPVASMISSPNVLVVNPSLPVNSVPELIAYAKANPGKLNMGSVGIGGNPHVAGELFKIMSGIDMVHVPYRSAAAVLTDLIAGQVQVYFASSLSSKEYIKNGQLRALAITSSTRTDLVAGVPALAEFLPGYEASAWFGIGAPANTPAEIIDKLNAEINKALADPKILASLDRLGAMPMVGTPAAFGTLLAEEQDKWAKVIRAANIKPE